jgi:serine protease Do
MQKKSLQEVSFIRIHSISRRPRLDQFRLSDFLDRPIGRPLVWLVFLSTVFLSGIGGTGSIRAQETLLERTGASTSADRVTRKPDVSRVRGSDAGTFVALAPELANVFDGREPSSLEELRALERQQARVAEVIDQVTVNIQQGAAQGSGVIITGDGFVLTAAHVAGGAERDATVILSDGTRLRARTYGMNRDKDAGLLKIIDKRKDGTPWPHATLGKSSDLKIGQWCVASGHPGGWKPERGAAIRVGRVLSINKGRDGKAHTLFTDCALIGGDSGGPLFTLEGRLVGIHSRIGTDVSDNMHVPIDVFADSWDRMARNEVWGTLPGFRPVIGVVGDPDDDRPRITAVAPRGPADLAGVKPDDVVLAVDGTNIRVFSELRIAVSGKTPGEIIILKVQRGNEILKLPVTVGVAAD